ncbi:MAG: prepilin peptidase [Firmicutes bacterium]|jgi:prepilin signal peptidase PulO-like enzyme (type II secretory pathway)|nr:prepilin peptidase [Bacillota bacterium]NBI61518.1 prepilin peptidase [Clostridiales bacterium]
MSNLIIILVKIFAAILLGILAGHGAVYVFNKIPAKWLCDYGEEPSEELKDPDTQRIKGIPWKWVFSGFFTVGAIRLAIFDWKFALAGLAFSWALLVIAAADKKYSIIPDQFVVLVGISAMGFIPYHQTMLQPLWGLLLGGGIMLASAVIGKLVFKKESLGMGDVKLFAAVGLCLGFQGTLTTLALSAVSSGAVFSILILTKKVKPGDMLPLGPYICGAAIFYAVIIWPLL